MPGQVPPEFEQVVGRFKAGVGVGVAPPTRGARGIVAVMAGPVSDGVAAANGVADWTGFGSCSLCTVYESPGAQNEYALVDGTFGTVFCNGVLVIWTSSFDSTTEVPGSAPRTFPVILR